MGIIRKYKIDQILIKFWPFFVNQNREQSFIPYLYLMEWACFLKSFDLKDKFMYERGPKSTIQIIKDTNGALWS